MHNFKLKLVASLVACCVANQISAQEKNEVDMIEEETQTYQTSKHTVTDEDLVDETRASSAERDRLRNISEISNFAASANKSQIAQYDAERELRVMKFIVENVPNHVLAAGEKAVQAYIMETFIERQDQAGELGVKVDRIWSSTDTALSKAPELNRLWKPEIDNKKLDSAGEDISIIDSPSENDDLDTGGLTPQELETIRSLGLSEAELRAMLGGDEIKNNQPEGQSTDSPPKPQELATTVTISDIDVGRVAIMGDITLTDIKLSMNASRGGDSRRITKTFKQVSPGYMFQVDEVRFEVIAINKQQVVIENVESKKTYRKLVNS